MLRSDGYTLGLFNRNLVLAQLASVEGMRVDLRQWGGLNVRIVTGYSGSPEIFLAIEKREADGIGISWTSLRPHVQRGLLRPLVRSLPGTPRDPELREVPVAGDLVTEPVAKAVLRLQDVPDRMARAFVAPPGASPELVRWYREAFRRLSQDRDFVAEAERAGFELAFLPGEECLRLVEEVLRTPSSVVRVFKELFRFGG